MTTATTTGARVEIIDLSAAYGRTRVLDGVRLTVEPGGWLAVIGPNGSGKSTLLRCALGLHTHDGMVRIDGVPAAGMPRRERARQVAYAPQSPVLPDAVSTRDYVLLGRTPHRALLAAPRAADRRVVADVMDRLEIGALADRPLRTLSSRGCCCSTSRPRRSISGTRSRSSTSSTGCAARTGSPC
jgi:iron complex transport system ATP-binding protein